MSPHQFQADRSDVLRRQLIQLPATVKQPVSARNPPLIDSHEPQNGSPIDRRRQLGLRIGGGTIAGAVLLGALALALTPEDRSEDASRIIESLAHPQKDTDRLPVGALPALDSTGIEPSQIRLLGHSATITYYGAPASEKLTPGAPSGKTICIIPVTANGESSSVGCTLLRNFESYGLKIETPDRTEAGWLVVPAAVETSLESVKNEPGWTQQAPNFLVRNNNK
jgi:hypothetical protein